MERKAISVKNFSQTFVDTHAHVFGKEFADMPKVIAAAREVGVTKILMPNLHRASIDLMLESEIKNPDVCFSMMGLHPCYVQRDFQNELYMVEEWLSKRRFVAMGEIGLDFYHDITFRNEQEEAFKIQINLASRYNMPVAIHCRNSFHETINILNKISCDVKGVFHCFTGSNEEAEMAIEMGFLLGIGGVVTFKNSGLDKVIEGINLNHVLLETDAPYLAPVPYRGKRNEPSYIPLIAEKIAGIKKITLQEVADTTTANACKLFGI